MKVLKLTGQQARFAACRLINEAPEGYVVKITEPSRTLEQNALLWPLLTCFAKQTKWPVNGVMSWMDEDAWKDVLSAAFEQESVQLAEGLNGGTVMLGRRTSQYGKKRFSEFIEFIYAAGSSRGVVFDRRGRKEAA